MYSAYISRLSFRFSALKYLSPPPIITSKRKSKYFSAILGCDFLSLLLTQKPAGVAWVMGTVVTQPAFLPAFLNFWKIGVYSSPFTPILIIPLIILCPQPQEELAAEESVTKELADCISIEAFTAKFCS